MTTTSPETESTRTPEDRVYSRAYTVGRNLGFQTAQQQLASVAGLADLALSLTATGRAAIDLLTRQADAANAAASRNRNVEFDDVRSRHKAGQAANACRRAADVIKAGLELR